jgi:amino acid adenylation domain-containing protein
MGSKSSDLMAVPRIPRRVNRDSIPLSFAQQRLWFLDQLEPNSHLYNVPMAVRLTGTPSFEALQKSFNAILARHEALRTIFVAVDGNPLQVIGESRFVEFLVTDLTCQPLSEREAKLQCLLKEQVRRPFNLSADLMLRASLVRLGEEEYLLLLVMHHIASDGWSRGVLFREIAALYQAFSTGESYPLPELSIQYADYAVWQQQWLQGEILARQLSYWKKQLSGIPLLEVPTDRPRPVVQTFRGARHSLVLPKGLVDGLKQLSRREGVTLFITMLAAWQTLLHRYTGQQDIPIGSPIAGRNDVETEGLIGFFVNTLVLRTDLSADPTFKQLIARVRTVALEAYEHQDLPFEKLVEELHPDRDQSHSPLFQVMFAFQNLPVQALALSGLTLSPVEVDSEMAKFDLTLLIEDPAGKLKAVLEYNTDLFDGDTIKRMLGHYQTLLEGIVANPERKVSELPLLTEAERHQLLVEWNDTKREYPRDKCIHDLFEEQAEKTPDAVAIVFEDEQLTYRELNGKANQLAHHLRTLGVGPEVLVGICVERSVEMVVGLLGILKAGGAYVPLDPEYPKERVAFMLEDTKASVLLTQERLLGDLPEPDGRVICLDRDWAAIAEESEGNPESGVTAENLAYVIYTSGSTGKPKGVMIQHASLVNYLWGFNDHSVGGNVQTLPTTTKPTFDASLKQLFAPFLRGDHVWIIPDDVAQEPAKVYQALASRAGASLNCVGSFWHAILAVTNSSEIAMPAVDLSSLLLGGESISRQLVERTFSVFPSLAVWNLYGPTEATANATIGKIVLGGRVTLGRPLPNVEIFILDSRLRPVPIGVPGELYIGGECLARGYLNRPELTAEKFITHSFDGEPARRLYRTGDLARYLSDGNIEFLGRIDDQVKIRGYRIELGEIESVLCQHSGVREAVVVAREDVPGDKRLVAYLVAASQNCSVSELRDFLKAKLPEHMIPSAFMFLEALPLMSNGKVDRKTLPVPDQIRPELEESFVAPRTAVEEILAEIWAELLKVERVGVHDNFFDLGGHSLLAAQLISRVRDAFHVEVPLRSLFEAPTAAGLAEGIEAARQKQSKPASLPIVPVPCGQESPLSFSQMRFWLLNQLQPNSFIHNCTHGFRLEGPLNVKALEQTFEEIVRRHEVLRTTFSMSNGEPSQRVAEQWSIKLPMIELTELRGADLDAEVRRLFENEFHRPFNLSADLMLRAIVLRLNDLEHVLILTIHHIAFDHWSIKTLYRELSVIYEACLAGQPCPLPEPPIQYKHYAIWRRQMFADAAFTTHLAYWKRQLRDSPPMLNLPTDHPRPLVQSFRGEGVALNVRPALVEALKALSREAGVTLFMTLLAAFKVLLSRLSGQEDIVVGSPVAGRDRSETENLIGLFLNNLALRTDLSGNPTFRELLSRVREVALGAYDHQDLPFEKLVEELNPDRDLSRTPLFQVFFNLYNFADAGLDLAGLSATPFHVTEPVSNFDLTLYVREQQSTTRLIMVYNADLFAPDRMNEMLAQLNHLLCQVVENPEQRIHEISLVTASAVKYLPDPAAPLAEPTYESVTTMFTSWVEHTPDQPAIRQGSQSWTYKELADSVHTLAHVLFAKGFQKGDVVAVSGPRSFGLIASMLAVFLEGGVLLTLDHRLPVQRRNLMLRDAKAKWLMDIGNGQTTVDGARDLYSRKTISVDQNTGCSEQQENDVVHEAPPFPLLAPDDPAYIFFTSGTTGVPKGVLGCHKGLGHFLTWQRKTFAVGPEDCCAQLMGLSFDAVLRDVLLPLTSGATLCLPPEEDGLASDRILPWLEREGITLLHVVPSIAHAWLDALPPGVTLHALRRLFFVGEPLTASLVQRWRQTFPQAGEIINLYGPTETTLVKCFYQVPAEEFPGMQPVGWPLPETQALVLAKNDRLCGIGEAGEIVLRTPFRSLGYINAPDEQHRRFVRNPWRNDAGDLLYYTGDGGRYRPDGSLEILGRLDHQVKIRGVRIEPDEVIAILLRHPGVNAGVVVARKDKEGQDILVAYVVPARQQELGPTELRIYLSKHLLAEMVPSAFVFLDSLPLTPNGKVDRKALPAPDLNRHEHEQAYVAPRSPTEEILAGIWAEIIKIERVGVGDNFFDLGGHSLLAMQVISRVREAFQTDLPLRTIFEKPTVEELTMVITEKLLERGGGQEMPGLLAEVESLSDEETNNLLKQGTTG